MAIELEDGTIIRSLPEEVSHLGEQQEETQIRLDNLQARVEAALAGVLHYKGSVATYSDLPDEAEIGDVYNAIDTGQDYAWTGSEWDELGSVVDVSKLVDLASPQTITGIKTFQPGLQVGRPSQNRLVFLTLNGLTLLPAVTSFDIGDNTNRVRAIYTTDINIVGGINKNSSGYKLTLPDTSALTADSELLDTASDQTITGTKTLSTNLVFSSPKSIKIGTDTSIALVQFGIEVYNIRPLGNNAYDCGTSSRRWKYVYTYNLADDTNSVSVADLGALIAYAKAQGWIS